MRIIVHSTVPCHGKHINYFLNRASFPRSSGVVYDFMVITTCFLCTSDEESVSFSLSPATLAAAGLLVFNGKVTLDFLELGIQLLRNMFFIPRKFY